MLLEVPVNNNLGTAVLVFQKMEVRFTHPQKILEPTDVTLSGMVMFVRLSQFIKQSLPMLSNFSDSVMFDNAVHP